MASLVGGGLRKGAPMQHQNRVGKKEGERELESEASNKKSG